MSLFANLKRNDTIAAAADYAGSTKLTHGLKEMTIEHAYQTVATSGAVGVVLRFKSPEGTHNETMYVTSGTAKGGTHYYTDKNKVQRFLPGFTAMNDICLISSKKIFTSSYSLFTNSCNT